MEGFPYPGGGKMSVRPIVRYPSPILRTIAQPVAQINDSIRELVQDLWDTMYEAGGVGLAANQIGRTERVCVLHPRREKEEHTPLVLINPLILRGSGELSSEEGCLSIPGFTAEVIRYQTVEVEALNLKGEKTLYTFQGFPAVVAQHEIDHLDGILFVDRLSWLKRELFEREFGRDPYRSQVLKHKHHFLSHPTRASKHK